MLESENGIITNENEVHALLSTISLTMVYLILVKQEDVRFFWLCPGSGMFFSLLMLTSATRM